MESKQKTDNQGEGNREAAQNYNEQTQQFIADGKVPEAADNAQPESEKERKAMEKAEKEGAARAKE